MRAGRTSRRARLTDLPSTPEREPIAVYTSSRQDGRRTVRQPPGLVGRRWSGGRDRRNAAAAQNESGLSGHLEAMGMSAGHECKVPFAGRRRRCYDWHTPSAGRPALTSTMKIERVVHLTTFADEERHRPRLQYWLSRPPAERLAAVEF